MTVSPIEQQRYEVFGQYLLIRRLKSGGMGGSLFLALNSKTDQLVVVKRISLKHEKKEQVTRFRDEIAIAKRLSHPGLIRILDGGDLDGHLFLEMDHIVGSSMGEIIDRCSRFTQRISPAVAVRIARDVCLALAYAHGIEELQLIHRDVSLSNIMLDFAGCVRLIDFGIAKSSLNRTKTLPGGAPGALMFAAPEQIAGRKQDNRVDIFSLGICLWMMLAGRPPRTHFDTPGAPVPRVGRFVDVPKELDDLVAIATADEPDARFQSATQMAAQLERFCKDISEKEVAEFFLRMAGSPDLRLGELETQKKLAKEFLVANPILLSPEKKTPGVPSPKASATLVVSPLRPPARRRSRAPIILLGVLGGMMLAAGIPLWLHFRNDRRNPIERGGPLERTNPPTAATPPSAPPPLAVAPAAPQGPAETAPVHPQETNVKPVAPPHKELSSEKATPPRPIAASPAKAVPLPESPEARPQDDVLPEITRRVEEADRLLKLGRYNSAEAIYAEVSGMPGGAPYAALGRANASLLRQRYDEAIASAADAARAIPNRRLKAQALVVKGRAEWKANQLAQAESDFQRAAELDPGSSEARDELTKLVAARSGTH